MDNWIKMIFCFERLIPGEVLGLKIKAFFRQNRILQNADLIFILRS